MAIPPVDRDAILRALQEFDQSWRGRKRFSDWEDSAAQKWALESDGKRYPPKQIVSIATGAPVSSFSGGPETNSYLQARSFTIVPLRDDELRRTFGAVLEKYPTLRTTETFGGNGTAADLFGRSGRILASWLTPEQAEHVHVVTSYGKGNWARVPWISLLDDRETHTTQAGTYVVYLFCEDGRGVYVKLAQGVTEVRKGRGIREAAALLEERAAALRASCAELAKHGFDLSGKSDLGSKGQLGRLYEASTIAAKFYSRAELPSDEEMRSDLQLLLEQYATLVSQKAPGETPQKDLRKLALVGTDRDIDSLLRRVNSALAANGAWASWWSFPIKEEAKARLKTPFWLYLNQGDGELAARLRVDAFQTSRGLEGIETPWPDLTEAEWKGRTRAGDQQSQVFKTWFRVTGVERFTPVRPLSDLEPAIGLSKPGRLAMQNGFGYAIDEDELVDEIEEQMVPTPPAVVPAPVLPIEWLVERTGLRRELLQEVTEALMGASPQILLAGPPGTSKTWLAQQLALFVTRNRPELTRFVQFHPNYSYESFMEGLRPVTKPGGIAFELTPGVVVDLVRTMHAHGVMGNPEAEHVIVIDEANRANLPRVLGELMFLFEYRDKSVHLQYSGDFALPTNLRFIGTMNTADRSIRAIDVALRRRFDVFELGPDPELLGRHYAANESLLIPSLTRGFAELNAALQAQLDRHHTIGHAFFMRTRMDASTLRSVWVRRVFPLIEEFFFDQPEIAKEFSLERFWPEVANA